LDDVFWVGFLEIAKHGLIGVFLKSWSFGVATHTLKYNSKLLGRVSCNYWGGFWERIILFQIPHVAASCHFGRKSGGVEHRVFWFKSKQPLSTFGHLSVEVALVFCPDYCHKPD
jgi:hypothetical protein